MAEVEVEQLKTKVAELEEQQKQAYELLKTMQASQAKESPEAQVTQSPKEAKQLVVVPNEHKLRKFSGRQGDNELSIDDFVDNAKSAITSRAPITLTGHNHGGNHEDSARAIEDLAANIKKMNVKPPEDGRLKTQPQFQQPHPRQNVAGDRCYRCGATDHFARNCSTRNQPPPLMNFAQQRSPNPLN
ncbi:hypothetical protein OS493_001306 [Desmophyllum pertusum]|uniref:CCHC-type domain-containing protein n=1 Tax=Desmophyllum pertusum TaxID=174260 RepID=A0A9W9ZUZ6_9CNID|nr:hypothetical protein OS493_001306 [Desmophyllum pertusum]